MLNGSRQIKTSLCIALSAVVFLVFASSPAAAWDITLAWDANTEANLDGYTVYFAKHTPGPPYDYVGDLPLSELANPEQPVASVSNLERHVNYYFALTAYDTDGNESSFSQQLCARADETIMECAPAAVVNRSNSSGSGSFAACFIQASGDSSRTTGQPAVSTIFLVLTMALAILISTARTRRN